jgi:hypothetical protein
MICSQARCGSNLPGVTPGSAGRAATIRTSGPGAEKWAAWRSLWADVEDQREEGQGDRP